MKIMVVDDDCESLKAMKYALELIDCDFQSSNDPVDAIIKLMSNEFDVIITDINMPYLNGFQLARVIKRMKPEIKFVFMSGSDNAENEQLVLSNGLYLQKPIDMGMLQDILDYLNCGICNTSLKKNSLQRDITTKSSDMGKSFTDNRRQMSDRKSQ